MNPDVLYEDNHCLAINKPAGLLSMGDATGDPSAVDFVRDYIKRKYNKPGDVFVGVVHRLDRPVSGVLLFARTSKGASRLSEQFRERTVSKRYAALVEGRLPAAEGELHHWLKKDERRNLTTVVPAGTPGATEGRLRYRVLERRGRHTLVEIDLLTGRSHQIRVQLAASAGPIVGDVKYGSPHRLGDRLALHARELVVTHPTQKTPLTITAPVPAWWAEWR